MVYYCVEVDNGRLSAVTTESSDNAEQVFGWNEIDVGDNGLVTGSFYFRTEDDANRFIKAKLNEVLRLNEMVEIEVQKNTALSCIRNALMTGYDSNFTYLNRIRYSSMSDVERIRFYAQTQSDIAKFLQVCQHPYTIMSRICTV